MFKPYVTGTRWLIDEHKKCLGELEHLKGLLSDLHHWIDILHERGQALFGAFQELKKHLEDVQRQMRDLHKQSHSYQVMMERLKKGWCYPYDALALQGR